MIGWRPGRQGSGYSKLLLWESKHLSCDAYLLKYPPNTGVPTHTDVVAGKQHYRINILICGEDNFKGETIFSSKRIKFFRPDISPHSVEKVSRARIILSIGWTL